MTGASLTANLASPQVAGRPVTFTASGTGGNAPYQYQWYVQQNGGAWQLVQSWNSATTYAWTPTQAGSYVIAIWARSAGATANAWQAYAERGFSINTSAPAPAPPPAPAPTPTAKMTGAALAANLATPQLVGTPVTFTASGTGGTAPYQYQWYVQQNGGAWQLAQSWSANPTYTWTPAQTGSYVVAIWARSAGQTTNAWEAYAERTFVVSTLSPPTSSSATMTDAWLTASPASPQVSGTGVTFTAWGAGGVAPYQYQ